MIYELVHDTDNAVTLFTRPRRFGKTLTMSMLDCFFNNQRTDGNTLFNGLDIMKYPEFCKENMNQYPVIFISLKDVNGRSFSLAYKKLKNIIADLCKKLVYLLDKPQIDEDDRAMFLRLKSKVAEEDEVQSCLMLIMRMMNAVYGKQVILLIDEYDVPLAQAHYNSY